MCQEEDRLSDFKRLSYPRVWGLGFRVWGLEDPKRSHVWGAGVRVSLETGAYFRGKTRLKGVWNPLTPLYSPFAEHPSTVACPRPVSASRELSFCAP